MPLVAPPFIQPQHVRCALCGADDTALLYRVNLNETFCKTLWFRGVEYTVGSTAQIVKCRRCGLGYTNPRVPYVEGWFPYTVTEEMEYFKATLVSRSIAFRNVLHRVPHWLGRRPESLLDVGCGDGLLIKQAQALGIHSLGVEISQTLVSAIQTTLGPASATTQPLNELPQASFDVVVLISVLEHAHDPVGLLQQVARVLRPDGILLVDVPNLWSLAAFQHGVHWNQIEPLGHLYYFTPKTLRAMLEKAGLRVVDRCVVSGRVDPLDTNCSRFKLALKHAFAWLERFTGVSVGYVARRKDMANAHE